MSTLTILVAILAGTAEGGSRTAIAIMLDAAAGLPPVERRIPAGAAYLLGALMESLYGLLRIEAEPPITRFVARQLSTAHWFDISAARRDLGYEPAISLDEGMERLAASFGERKVIRDGDNENFSDGG